MNTEAVAVLVAAAAAGSLSGAARRLGITPMVATRRLAALERDLGVRLMQRTTRALSLTPEGEAFLPFAQTLVEGEAAGRAVLRSSAAGASGLLRVTAPVSFGRRVILPFVPRLLRDHPGLRIEMELTDNVVDIVATGVDLAIRIARLRDNSLIARRLGPSPRLLCAAPEYLRERGTPRRLDDLAGHDCLTLTGATHWSFHNGAQERRVRVAGRFSASSIEGVLDACIHGAGIALAAEWNVREDLRAGRLVPIALEDMPEDDRSIWAVYPTTRQVLPKMRVFLSALEAALARP